MSKLKSGVKSKLIGELVIITYILVSALASKYIIKGKSTGFGHLVFWLVIWECYIIYDKKFSDIFDEASKNILSKVNEVALKMMFYSIIIMALFYITPYTKNIFMSNMDTGIILLAILFTQALLKLGLFIYFDRKGIYD